MQRNWIGRSEGAAISFKLEGLGAEEEHLDVFTTAHDTIYGVTFMVVAPEHPLITKYAQFADNFEEIQEYVEKAARKSELDREIEKKKTGVAVEGLFAINPANGKKIPVWIADYVLLSYGTGAIMAVPGEDERDFEFATKYELPIIYTTEQQEFISYQDIKANKQTYKLANSEEFDGQNFETGRTKILEKLMENGAGESVVQYKIRDWLISRQRYWGSPIPIIHCEKDGAVAVPEKDLPVLLPEVESYHPTGEGSVLASVEEWVNTTCPTCGGPAKRETDTMDGYACSSWYYLRYTDPKNSEKAWDPTVANYWMPIDYYCGGDHAVSHLLYSRFWMYFFADQGWISEEKKEPVDKLVYNGYILAADGNKMSKSKGNVVNPDELIEQGYGADAVRMFEMFIAPYDQDTKWNINGVPGTFRFIQRFWGLAQEYLESTESIESSAVLPVAHKVIKSTTNDLDDLRFNTAVANLMEAVNSLYKIKAETGISKSDDWKFTLESMTQLIAPFAPHVAEELWQQFGYESSVHTATWPTHDEKYLISDTMKIVVQVNGKVRATLEVPTDTSKEVILEKAQQQEKVAAQIGGNPVKKSIYVPGKLVSLVV